MDKELFRSGIAVYRSYLAGNVSLGEGIMLAARCRKWYSAELRFARSSGVCLPLRRKSIPEIAQQVLSMRRTVTSARVPSPLRLIDIVMPMSNGPESRHALVPHVVNQSMQMSAARRERLVATGDERGPEGRNRAGAGGRAGADRNQNLAAVARVGGTGNVRHSAALLSGGTGRNFCVLLPLRHSKLAAHSAAGGAFHSVMAGVPHNLFCNLRSCEFRSR